MTTPQSWSVNQLAARAVALHAGGRPAERLELLEVLGLVAEDVRIIVQDDTKVYRLEDVGKAPAARDPDASSPLAFAEHGRRPEGMTTPPGLAQLPSAAERPKAARRARVGTATCGTYGGYQRHRRRQEVACQPCAEAARVHWRDKNHGRPRRTRPPIQCGTTGGYARHQRQKEPTCADCRAAVAAYQREYAARRREAS